MQTIYSIAIITFILKILNHIFDYKKKIRARFKSNFNYRFSNTIIFILVLIPFFYKSGLTFITSNLGFKMMFGLFYINYLPKENK